MLFVHVQVYQKQKFEFDQRHPVLLPSSNYFTKLLILYTHGKVCHAGVESTLTELRLKYWIIKGQQTVRKIIKPCVTCKKIQGKVLRPPHPHQRYLNIEYVQNFHFKSPVLTSLVLYLLRTYILKVLMLINVLI